MINIRKFGYYFGFLIISLLITSIFSNLAYTHTTPNQTYSTEPDTNYVETIDIASHTRGSRSVSLEDWPMFRYNKSGIGFNANSIGPGTNNVRWTFNTSGSGVYSSAAIVDGIVYIGSEDGQLYCLNLSNGEKYWNFSTGSNGIFSSPAFSNGKVFVGNIGTDQLWCLNASTGVPIWNFSWIDSGKGMYSSPTVVGGYVYFGTDSSKVFCLPENDPNSDGMISAAEITWQYTTTDMVWSTPAVVGNLVFIGVGDGLALGTNSVICLNKANGGLVWSYNDGGNVLDVIGSPAVEGGFVYVASSKRNLYKLNAGTGAQVWRKGLGPGGVAWGSPAVGYGRVFIGVDSNKLTCFDLAGNKIWTYTATNKFRSSPTLADDKLYIGCMDGKVYCLSAITNNDPPTPIWTYTVTATPTNGVWSSPAISEGKVVIGGEHATNAGVYCFGPTDSTYPTVISNFPSNLATGVPLSTNIKINFSEFMNISLINTANILVKDGSGGSVAGTVNWDIPTKMATFTPSSALNRSETYDIIVQTQIKDLAGLNLDGNNNGTWEGAPADHYTFNFTTILNKEPVLTSPQLSPLQGDKNTNFVYKIIYTDLDDDSPATLPAYIKVHIDNDAGHTMILDASAPTALCDNNYVNGEQYTYGATISTYGTHTYQFKCFDAFDLNQTQVLNNPFTWFKQELGTIPDQIATEDIDLVLNVGNYYTDEDTDKAALTIKEDSTYATVNDFNITFNYPNSFNFPSGTTLEVVKVTLNDSARGYEVSKNVNVNVIAVNDRPQIAGVEDLQVNEGTPDMLDVSANIDDEDNVVADLSISTNSSYTTVNGKEITFSYPKNCGILIEFVKISVFDGALYGHQNISVNVIPEGAEFTVKPIPTQEATEDIDLALDMADYIIPLGGYSLDDFDIDMNSSYGDLVDTVITFNYPNSFNYPSGRTFEMVNISVSEPISGYEISQNVRINVLPVNDPPQITDIYDLQVYAGLSYVLDITDCISDEDNNITELTISSNSSFAEVDNEVKEITFFYPEESEISIDFVQITVNDSEHSAHQNISVTIIDDDLPFILLPIPDQNATEDIDLIVDLERYIIPNVNFSIDDLEMDINSSNGKIEGSELIFNYPNSFNYPSGRTYEFIKISVSYQNFSLSQNFKINVQPINDGPALAVVKAPTLAEENASIMFEIKYFDIDGSEDPLVELVIENEYKNMTLISGEIHSPSSSGTYQLELQLLAGNYTYYFRADDLEDSTLSVVKTKQYQLEVVKDIIKPPPYNDSDNDNIPDEWELEHGLDPFDPDDAQEDLDNDTYTNLQEYLGIDGEAGGNDSSDPNDPLDIPIKEQIPEDGRPKTDGDNAWVAGYMAAVAVIMIILILLILFLFQKQKRERKDYPEERVPDDANDLGFLLELFGFTNEE